MCVSVVDVYKEKVNDGECSCGEEEELNSERRREEGIRWNYVCKCSR
jgi:hypothetical protein